VKSEIEFLPISEGSFYTVLLCSMISATVNTNTRFNVIYEKFPALENKMGDRSFSHSRYIYLYTNLSNKTFTHQVELGSRPFQLH
jgi:hypothetical protein